MAGTTLVIAEQSYIIRNGIIAIIHDLNIPVRIIEVNDQEQMENVLLNQVVNVLLINPGLLKNGEGELLNYRSLYPNLVMIALDISQGGFRSHPYTHDQVSVYDDHSRIVALIQHHLISSADKNKQRRSTDLSKREISILTLVAQGFTNQEIAEKLFISAHTVITHRKNITSKLGIKTVAGLTVYAILNHLINPEAVK